MSILADQMGFEVTYHGVNPVGQHLFANGEPVVTDVCATLEEAVKRFGKRIDTRSRELHYSMMFMQGHAKAMLGFSYHPMLVDAQSLKEYGLGFMQGLIDKEVPVKAVVKAPVVVVEPEPVKEPEKVAEKPAPKKRKRRKKRTIKAKKKDVVLDID